MTQPYRSYHADTLIWAGAYPSTYPRTAEGTIATLTWLATHKIEVIIDLTSPDDPLPDYTIYLATHTPQIERLRFPIRDMSTPSEPMMLAILDAMSAAVAAGKGVYVHCWGGVGRTGTVIGCWYVRHGATGDEALVRLNVCRAGIERESPETDAQRTFIQTWREPAPEAAQIMRTLRNRYRGAMIGMAVGDAIGTTIEFSDPGTESVHDMVGGGPFMLPVGAWTDDTSMALCLAESLILQQEFDAADQMRRYTWWHERGYFSSIGHCFDIGITTRQALMRFARDGNPIAGSTSENTAGNGSLMRLAPIPLMYGYDDALCVEYARQSSRTTHGAPQAVDACAAYALLIAGALRGHSHAQLCGATYAPLTQYQWHHTITEVVNGSYRHHQPPHIAGTGYVVKSFEAAMWALYHHETFADAVLAGINLGEDADTTGAIVGQLAGALYGESRIPIHWRQRLVKYDVIAWRAEELLKLAWPMWQVRFGQLPGQNI
jgi:ADP-ribosyl-[dinitrogen reductase] hydrolase